LKHKTDEHGSPSFYVLSSDVARICGLKPLHNWSLAPKWAWTH